MKIKAHKHKAKSNMVLHLNSVEEIEYEKRKAEIDSLTDDIKHKEESDKLEKDLLKGKRRKLGNIV